MFNNEKRRNSNMPAVRRPTHPAIRALDDREDPLFKRIIVNSFWGILYTVFSGLILTALTAWGAILSPDPGSLVTSLGFVSLLPSCFLGGFVTAKRTGEAPLCCALTHSAILTIVLLIISLCSVGIASSGHSLWRGIMLHMLSALFSVLGAFSGNIKRRKRPGKKRFGN